MQNQNADPHLTTLIQNADLDQIHQALTLRLVGEVCEHGRRMSALEKKNQEILRRLDKLEIISSSHQSQLQECQGSVSLLETEIPHLRHLVSQNEELENRLAFLAPPD